MSTPPAHDTARVSVVVSASVEATWTALTERNSVARWFGDLSGSLAPGGAYRLDFGDGDFFELGEVEIEHPRRLSYRWRFLGIGPQNTISWSIEPFGTNCRVTVTDADANRSLQGVEEMIEGWTDFLQRLQQHCATGRNTRYAWRKEFDGSIELPLEARDAFERLFSEKGQAHWLPWCARPIAPGARVSTQDGSDPAQLTIGAVERSEALDLQFTLTCPEWRAQTTCSLKIRPRADGALLVVAHNGWPKLDTSETEQATQRARFCKLWTRALRAAQQFAQA